MSKVKLTQPQQKAINLIVSTLKKNQYGDLDGGVVTCRERFQDSLKEDAFVEVLCEGNKIGKSTLDALVRKGAMHGFGPAYTDGGVHTCFYCLDQSYVPHGFEKEYADIIESKELS